MYLCAGTGVVEAGVGGPVTGSDIALAALDDESAAHFLHLELVDALLGLEVA